MSMTDKLNAGLTQHIAEYGGHPAVSILVHSATYSALLTEVAARSGHDRMTGVVVYRHLSSDGEFDIYIANNAPEGYGLAIFRDCVPHLIDLREEDE